MLISAQATAGFYIVCKTSTQLKLNSIVSKKDVRVNAYFVFA